MEITILAKFKGCPVHESPALSGDWRPALNIDWSKAYPCFQPCIIDYNEFNLVLNVDGVSYLARSVDFDFVLHREDETLEALRSGEAVAFIWSVDDVKELRPKFTLEQCKEVLSRIQKSHDANTGINWCLLDSMCEEIEDEKT